MPPQSLFIPIAMNNKPTFEKTFEADSINLLDLQNFTGDLELIAHDENTIKVEIYASVRSIFTFYIYSDPLLEFDFDTHDLRFEQSGDTFSVYAKPRYFNVFNWFNFQSTSFRIYIPTRLSSQTKTFGGDVSLKGIGGNHFFETWGGKILAQNTVGNLKGKTMGGKIELISCQGSIDVSTMGGNIFVANNQADIRLDTKGGNMLVQNHKGSINGSSWGGKIEAFGVEGSFECHTLGGNIRLNDIHGNIGVSTKGGNIFADIQSLHQYAWFDTSGGNIKITMPLNQPMNLDVSGSRIQLPPLSDFKGLMTNDTIHGTILGGGPTVSVKTLGGKIKIRENNQPYEPIRPTDTTVKDAHKTNINLEKKPVDSPKATFLTSVNQFDTVDRPKPFGLKPPYDLGFSVIFCLLVGYGITSIAYFTLEILGQWQIDFSAIQPDMVLLTTAAGLSATLACYIFLTFIEPKIPLDEVKFLPLMGCAFASSEIIQWSILQTNVWAFSVPMAMYFYLALPAFISWAFLYYWFQHRNINRKISEKEYQLLNLEKLKSKAQLDALEAKINPHFLYNALNSIAGLIHEQPNQAEEMTIQLSKLFRYTTGRTEESFHTLFDELEIIRAYLSIEEVRFGHRLSYTIACDESLYSQQIPRFLLQPLVENAIKHGISKIAEKGIIEVTIKQDNDLLTIQIQDNGPDFAETLGGGFGLRSVKEKLKLLYSNKASLELKNNPKIIEILIMNQ